MLPYDDVDDIKSYFPNLLKLVRNALPEWNDVNDPRFIAVETAYKRDASVLAKELLGKASLESLLSAGEYDEFIGRLKAVASKTNLLFMGVPQKGDLALINQPDADPEPICRAIFELFHAENQIEDRLSVFFDFVANNDLPQKWTFPTYYLFLLYPDSEIFVKPTIMGWFSKFTGGVVPYTRTPTAPDYMAMRQAFHALLEELRMHSAVDMIDVQSFVWVAANEAKLDAVFDKAVERLGDTLASPPDWAEWAEIERSRDEVVHRFAPLFSVEHLPELTAEEFISFLSFENNHHWTGIGRYGSRIVKDLPTLREALAGLHDESQDLADRYDNVRNSVRGLGKAVLTPILLVTHPDTYGVWNAKAESGLRSLKLFPKLEGKPSEGEQYAAINEVLKRLVAELEIDLWTLDAIWGMLFELEQLAEPFASIFSDREQAEWAFDFLAETVDLAGGSVNDRRFALTVPGKNVLRLNFGNWMFIDFERDRPSVRLALLIAPVEKEFPFKRSNAFAHDKSVGVFWIPLETARKMPDGLRSIYEASMVHIDQHFGEWKGSPYKNWHRSDVFRALFDEEMRNRLLSNGLDAPQQERRFWRITLPTDLREDNQEGHRDYNFWQDCLDHGVAAIGFDSNPEDPQIARFAQIAAGDNVVAFLRSKTIGGIGEVTSPYDERLEQERPSEKDLFHGRMWRRIGVDWQAVDLSVDDLPEDVRNKFRQGTVLELSQSEFQAVQELVSGKPPVKVIRERSSIASQFEGFSDDAFAFMADLGANNNKAWMEQNRGRWKASVQQPMRDLFADLGPLLKIKFDPYLQPDALEIRPTANQVMSRLYKNWSAKPDSLYHEYYWGAFYRERLTKQTDAQMFVILFADLLRFGFYVGGSAKPIRDQFRTRVLHNAKGFFDLIDNLNILSDFEFVRIHEEGKQEIISVHSASDLRSWVESGDFDLLLPLPRSQIVSLGPALIDHIFDAFRRIFPIYLWAIAGDPQPLVERYLMAEFSVIDNGDDGGDPEPEPEPFTERDFLKLTHLTGDTSAELREMLLDRNQVIFYGPPGTGKTFVAKHLACRLTGLAKPPPERLEIIQFHPAYSYEDFLEGIRPESKSNDDGTFIVDYPPREGVFVRFCRSAEHIDGPCVFIIDEINRGNIPRIFGELMLLLEYRDLDVPLPYSGTRFRIPENVFIIGTMNTADRSIALVDFALRRRFHFFEFTADPDLFDRWLENNPTNIPYLAALYRRLSEDGVDDPNFAVGPSYFMHTDLTEQKLQFIWRRSILPYLKEYYFDQPAQVERWRWDDDFMRRTREDADGS